MMKWVPQQYGSGENGIVKNAVLFTINGVYDGAGGYVLVSKLPWFKKIRDKDKDPLKKIAKKMIKKAIEILSET